MPRCLCELVGVKLLLLNLRVGSWISERFLEKTISVACLVWIEGHLPGIGPFRYQIHIFIKCYRRTNTHSYALITENIDVSSANIFMFD